MVEAVEEGRNCSSTSQQQAWGKAPKKGQGLHEPKFAKDIKIVGVREDVSQQSTESRKNYRSDFDPRVRAHRSVKPLRGFNLAWLASLTNGNCGVLAHCKPEPSPHHALPDLSDLVSEERVSTSHPALTVQQAYEAAKKHGAVSPNTVMRHLQVNAHQQSVLAKETQSQASSDLWKEHRIGRITASVAGDCVGSVKDNNISGHSQIAKVMGYYGNPQSAALSWGKTQEAVSRKHYLANHRRTLKHTGVQCQETGLWVNLTCPYVAASPDGIVCCSQCGTGLLELKNSYTHRHKTIDELARTKGSCLSIENGIVILNRTHAYYAQVQVQMWATGHTWCDFVVRTASPSKNFFVERILFDKEYIDSIKPKLEFFFCKGILQELETKVVQDTVVCRAVRKTMDEMLTKLEHATMDSKPSVEYPCGVCGDACEDSPADFEYNSIGCDNCQRWFHYICVDISGHEKFLKDRSTNWKCPACGPRKRRRTNRK